MSFINFAVTSSPLPFAQHQFMNVDIFKIWRQIFKFVCFIKLFACRLAKMCREQMKTSLENNWIHFYWHHSLCFMRFTFSYDFFPDLIPNRLRLFSQTFLLFQVSFTTCTTFFCLFVFHEYFLSEFIFSLEIFLRMIHFIVHPKQSKCYKKLNL